MTERLCIHAAKFQTTLTSDQSFLRKLVHQAAYARDQLAEAHYVEQLAEAKAHVAKAQDALDEHVATCEECLALLEEPVEARTPVRAPHNLRDDLPDAHELARLVRETTINIVAEDFNTAVNTIAVRLANAGYTRRGTQDIGLDGNRRLSFNPQPWADQGLCNRTDPDAFFPEKGGSTREAKAVCGRCTVQAECLTYALDNEERFGIWGGLSERERRALKPLTTSRETGWPTTSTATAHLEEPA